MVVLIINLENIIGQDCKITYAVEKTRNQIFSGKLISIIAMSETTNFIVLSNKDGEILLNVDGVIHIKLKINQNNKEDKRRELC